MWRWTGRLGFEPGNIDKYLPLAKGYGWSDAETRHHLGALFLILQIQADSVWGLDATDLVLRARLSKTFSLAASRDSLDATRRDTFDDLEIEGATNTENLKEVSGDDSRVPSQGDHIHPSI